MSARSTSAAIASSNPGVTSRQLCDVLGILPPNLVGLLKSMEQRGLIVRRPHPEDGRGFEVLGPVYLRLGRADDAARAGTRSIVQQVQVIVRERQMAIERSARFIADRKIAHAYRVQTLPILG